MWISLVILLDYLAASFKQILQDMCFFHSVETFDFWRCGWQTSHSGVRSSLTNNHLALSSRRPGRQDMPLGICYRKKHQLAAMPCSLSKTDETRITSLPKRYGFDMIWWEVEGSPSVRFSGSPSVVQTLDWYCMQILSNLVCVHVGDVGVYLQTVFLNSGKRASQFSVFLLGFTRDCGGPPWPKRRRLVPPMLLRSRHQLHLIVLVRWQVRWRRCSGWHLAPRAKEVGHGWRWTSHRNLPSPTSPFVNAGNQLSHTE